MNRFITLLALACAAVLAGCGGGDDKKAAEAASPAPAAASADLTAIKDYLLEHTERLTTSVTQLERDAQEYHNLLEDTDWDYEELVREHREEAAAAVRELQSAHIQASPAYEEMEGIVAGVPALADYHVIIDAGSDGSDPENAVPFSITTPRGTTWERPGNLFALIETSVFGTESKFQAEGVEADLDGNGKVEFPEALPDADFVLGVAKAFTKYAAELADAAQRWEPTLEDAFTAVVVMTPTMSESFRAWKNSRFVAGDEAQEKGFVAISCLQDIRDILGGLNLIYAGIQPSIETVDRQQAIQTRDSLQQLQDFASRLLTEEEGGKTFTAEEADTLGTEAQRNAEAIAGQVAQAADQLGLELES